MLYSLSAIFLYVVFLSPPAIPFRAPKFLTGKPTWTPPAPNTIEYKKRLSNYPPPYPNGWYMLADSKEIRAGELRHIAALGQNFAVFRGNFVYIAIQSNFHHTNTYSFQ